MKKLKNLRPLALIAVGVFLGRGAHADTTLTFDSDASACTPPQIENPNAPPGITNFGNYAAASSGGVAVSGFGTPNINLGWAGPNYPDTRWEYYDNGPWTAAQLQGCFVGTAEELIFTPNNPSASAEIESFNFFPYYDAVTDANVYGGLERYTFNVSVLSGTTVVSGPTMFTFTADGTDNHPVNINYTGAPGQTLKLRLDRIASTLDLGAGEIESTAYSIAVDKIAFAQTPATTFPAGPQVVSVTPADDTSGVPATPSPAYAAIIADGPTLTAAAPIQLRLDGNLVSPAPTVTPLGGGQTSVSYPGAASVLLTSGFHVYTLTYDDNLGGTYTNQVVFSTIYTTLPAAYALPPGSGAVRGLIYRSVSASSQVIDPETLDSSIARAEAQLNGTLMNPDTSQPYTNDAVLGPNANGSYNIDTVLNFTDGATAVGDFEGDQLFPGLPFPPNNWFSTEALLYLDLPAGYYRFGVNSDDGFEVTAIPPQGVAGAPIVTGVIDSSRGSADTLFDVLVPTSGVYPFRVVYFQSSGAAEEEFFSVTNLVTGGTVLINDTNFSNAISSYRVLAPHITSISQSGANVILNWTYGTPPFQVQVKTNLTDAVWNNVGSPTPSSTATVPIQSGSRFFRVFGQ